MCRDFEECVASETAIFLKGEARFFKKTLENCPPFRVLKAFFFCRVTSSLVGLEEKNFHSIFIRGAKRVALLDQPLCGFRRTRRRRTRKRASERERERESRRGNDWRRRRRRRRRRRKNLSRRSNSLKTRNTPKRREEVE